MRGLVVGKIDGRVGVKQFTTEAAVT